MTRRKLLGVLALCAPACFAESSDGATTVRGKLKVEPGKAPVLDVKGRLIALDGDDATRGVLNDDKETL